jgi:hypothetical protein
MTAVDQLASLVACEAAAGTRAEGRLAWVTWVIGTRSSWLDARRGLSRASWYRQLKVLQLAGLPLPEDVQDADSVPASFLGPYRARSGPGVLLRLPGQRFSITKPLDEWIVPGVTGTVHAVQFRRGEWTVGVQLDGSPGGYEELDLGVFVGSTEPLPESVPAGN